MENSMSEPLTILLMRHAHAEPDAPGGKDSSRRLDDLGQEEAAAMGELLRDQGLSPDFVLCSTARRAEETARWVLSKCSAPATFLVREALYLAEPGQILEALLEVPDDRRRVLLVGHNPGITELVAVMTKEFRSMPTAAVAEIAVVASTTQAVASSPQGRLVNFHLPSLPLPDPSLP